MKNWWPNNYGNVVKRVRIVMNIKYTQLCLLVFLYTTPLLADGFVAGTLVKIPTGYIPIEQLSVGDVVLCTDFSGEQIERRITSTISYDVERSIIITVDGVEIYVSSEHRFYQPVQRKWVHVYALTPDDMLLSGLKNGVRIDKIIYVDQPVRVYSISVADYHNFYVTTRDICVHNVVPLVAVGLCFAFGAGKVVFTGISVSLAAALGMGTVGFAFKKHQDKQKWKLLMQPKRSGGEKKPDDEDEKKKNRETARENFEPMTNKKAREEANKLGYKEVKDHPCGDTRGKPVFESPKGNRYISADADGHNGGMWKVFNRAGDLVYSMDIDLITICKEYK